MRIGNYPIGQQSKPFIIAEMSGNHNQSLERALKIIEVAAACGADAIKLQTYTADTLTINELYQEAHTPWEWHQAMYKCAADHGILCFSTPFDDTAVDFLESLNTPAHKIASFENNHFPLLKKVAQTGKPIIMSTGASSLANLAEAVEGLRSNGCKELVLLKCTSNYPSTP